MPKPKRRRQYRFGSLQKRGRRWRVQWMEGTRRRSKSFTAVETAEAYLRVKVGAVELADAGLPVPPAPDAKTLGQLVPKWIEGRKKSHRSWRADQSRWNNHLEPALGHLRPDQVDARTLKAITTDRLAAGLNPATVRLLMRLLSTLFSDLVDDGEALRNPVASVPKKVRRLYRPTYDPKTTPFVELERDIGRIFFALPEPINIAYVLGALAGLRTGEGLALRWPHVDLERRRIHVRESIEGPLKDKDSRVVPVLDALLPILVTWRGRARALAGRVVPPLRVGSDHLDPHTLGAKFSEALGKLKPPLPQKAITWYQATRHTFASHWVMAGGDLPMLQEILGHSSITTTQRYAHLRPEAFAGHHGRLAALQAPEISTTSAPAALRGLKGKVLELDGTTVE